MTSDFGVNSRQNYIATPKEIEKQSAEVPNSTIQAESAKYSDNINIFDEIEKTKIADAEESAKIVIIEKNRPQDILIEEDMKDSSWTGIAKRKSIQNKQMYKIHQEMSEASEVYAKQQNELKKALDMQALNDKSASEELKAQLAKINAEKEALEQSILSDIQSDFIKFE